MKLSYLNDIERSRSIISNFYGYKHTLVTEAGAFYDCANMTSDDFPVIKTRNKRRIVTDYGDTTVVDIVGKDKLGYISGNKFCYNGTEICSVSAGKKQFVSMGAYLLIFPDKICFNTYDNSYSSMAAEKVCSSASIESKTITGDTIYTKKWVRITATSAFSDFAVGDGIKIEWSYGGADYTATCNITDLTSTYIDTDAAVDTFTGKVPPTAIKIKREVPDMDYFAECNNRVWGCSSANHEIYACKLGDPKNWNSFAGIASDSYAATVGTDGDFTGAASYLDYVIFFKENYIHKIYGTRPANFQITEVELQGVRSGSSKSIAKVGDALLYQSQVGIMAYTGGSTSTLISSALGDDTYKNGVAGGHEGKYYLSTQKDGATSYTLFVYDTDKGIWHRDYSAVEVIDFAQTESGFYGLYGNKLVFFDGAELPTGTDEATLDFLLETGEFGLDTPDRKHISKMQLRVRLGSDTTLDVYASYNNGTYSKIQTFTTQEEKAVTIPFIPKRCDRVRFKLSGTGSIELYSIAFTTEAGSEI